MKNDVSPLADRETATGKSGRQIGYVRTTVRPPESVVDADSQRDALVSAGVALDDIYVDTEEAEAKSTRPGLASALEAVSEGDVVVVVSLDRLAHSTQALLQLLADVRKAGGALRVLDLESASAGLPAVDSPALARVLLELKRMETSLQKERMAISAHRRSSTGENAGGRRAKFTDDDIREAVQRVAAGEAIVNVAKDMGMSRATLYRRMQDLPAPLDSGRSA